VPKHTLACKASVSVFKQAIRAVTSTLTVMVNCLHKVRGWRYTCSWCLSQLARTGLTTPHTRHRFQLCTAFWPSKYVFVLLPADLRQNRTELYRKTMLTCDFAYLYMVTLQHAFTRC